MYLYTGKLYLFERVFGLVMPAMKAGGRVVQYASSMD